MQAISQEVRKADAARVASFLVSNKMSVCYLNQGNILAFIQRGQAH